jgi:hypothetical protein
VVFHVLGDAIDLVLGLVHLDLRVGAGDGVDFSSLLLLFEDGSFANADSELCVGGGTLSSLLEVCGESSFSLYLLFSIMSSKSMSTFLPLCRLSVFFSSFSRLASSILILLSSRFFSIFLI